jgi:hypothetical protein
VWCLLRPLNPVWSDDGLNKEPKPVTYRMVVLFMTFEICVYTCNFLFVGAVRHSPNLYTCNIRFLDIGALDTSLKHIWTSRTYTTFSTSFFRYLWEVKILKQWKKSKFILVMCQLYTSSHQSFTLMFYQTPWPSAFTYSSVWISWVRFLAGKPATQLIVSWSVLNL